MCPDIPIWLQENLHADLAREIRFHGRNKLSVTSVNQYARVATDTYVIGLSGDPL